MRILFLTATYCPSMNGVAVSVKSTAEMLRSMGHQVTILAPDNLDSKHEEDGLIRYSSLPNPIIKDYPIPVLPLNSKIINMLLEGKYDIVHTHHPFHIAAFAKNFANAGKVPLVFTYHTKYESYADIYLKFLPKDFRSKIIKLGTNYVCKNADLIVAPSTVFQKKLERDYPEANILKIPTGVKLGDEYSSQANVLRKKLKKSKEKTILLSLSRLAKEKNIKLAINSLTLLPSKFHLVIAGSGPQEEELKTLVKAKKLSKRVTFLGKVAHEEVLKVMKVADIFLFPSTTETQGLNLLEAMSAGLPVVAVKSEVSEEWIPDYVGILTQNKPRQFAQAIEELYSSIANSHASVKAKLIKKWAANFTLERTVEMLLAGYQKAIDHKRINP